MEFELDKHDLFRNVVPGFIFLLVLFSFYLVANNFELRPADNIASFLSVMAIAITLPIGYLIHHIYRAFHILLREQASWENFEAKKVKGILDDATLKKLTKKHCDKLFSWLLEAILHDKGNESFKDRGYTLISRIHSSGSAIAAIILGILFSLFYFLVYRSRYEYLFIPVTLCWSFVIVFLWKGRASTHEGHEKWMDIFVDRNKAIIKEGINKIIEKV